MLREGSAKEIVNLLDSAPSVHTLVLSSKGGRLLEGKLLATAVVQRALDTYVEDICVSTCTFVFLAGKERAATPNAKVGFHSPSFSGENPELQQAGTEFMIDVYRNAGLPKQFLDRVRTTPAADMWYPTRDELIAARVVTRFSLGGETTTLFSQIPSKAEMLLVARGVPLWQSLERRFPDLLVTAVDRGWKAKEQGSNDNQIATAMRSAVADLIPVLLRESNTDIIEKFVALIVDQMRTARAVSFEACRQYSTAELNPVAIFPKELRDREERLMIEALNSPPTPKREYSKQIAEKSLAAAASKISAEYIDVVANPANYQARPDLTCNGTIAVFEAVLSLPSGQRAAALEEMYKG